MPTLTWNEELALSHPQMDATHEEFVTLLSAAEAAWAPTPEGKAACLARYEALVDHTIGHFGQEDRWMQATGFASSNCHSGQHTQVLALMHEVTRLAKEKDEWGPLERVLPELGKWFAMHAQTMDAMLASHLEQVGYDPDTGFVGHPLNTSQPITGCGGDHVCATDPGQQAQAVAAPSPTATA
jgi:hemerythrin-like metal-binding protein